jgi:ribosomal protein S25
LNQTNKEWEDKKSKEKIELTAGTELIKLNAKLTKDIQDEVTYPRVLIKMIILNSIKINIILFDT